MPLIDILLIVYAVYEFFVTVEKINSTLNYLFLYS